MGSTFSKTHANAEGNHKTDPVTTVVEKKNENTSIVETNRGHPEFHQYKSNSEIAADLFLNVVINTVFVYGIFYLTKQIIRSIKPMMDELKESEKNRSRLQQLIEKKNGLQITTNSYEEIIAADIVDPNDIDVCLNDIGGLESQKREMYELIILPLRRPEIFRSREKLLPIPKGILLYGLPGTGKTMLAKAIAKESGAFFIDLKLSTIMSKWFGESQKLVRAVFSLARKLSPCIIFIDEVDSFMGSRSKPNDPNLNHMKTEFMALWDGFASNTATDLGVIVMGATNRPADVDTAFLRRMPRSFEIHLPGTNQRCDILEILLREEAVDKKLNLLELAKRTESYSGSDLKELCRAALMIPLREMIEKTNRYPQKEGNNDQEEEKIRPLILSDFLEAMKSVPPTGFAASQYEARMNANQPDHEMLAAMLAGLDQLFRGRTRK